MNKSAVEECCRKCSLELSPKRPTCLITDNNICGWLSKIKEDLAGKYKDEHPQMIERMQNTLVKDIKDQDFWLNPSDKIAALLTIKRIK